MKNTEYKMVTTDVLIIGSGGAGLRTAIELHDRNVDVLVVGKCEQRKAHTIAATGGINAALGTMDPDDSWQLHAADTIRDGGHINDTDAVLLLCKNAPQAIKELDKWHTGFAKDSRGKIVQRYFGAATFRRACFVGDMTGRAILNSLVDQTIKRKIRFQSNVYIYSLLHNRGSVNGALGLDMQTGALILIHAKTVVLATGGHSRMFSRCSSGFWENNGDGIGLAVRMGAKTMDMEMFQFHPTGMVYPHEAAGMLVTEAVRGEGGILTNARGERFMKRYDPERMELSARDVVARAIYQELKEGRGTKRGGVWLDITHRPKSYILKRLPTMYAQFQKYNHLDISKQKMEVAPTAHYSMGGLLTDQSSGATTVPGLFAVGEVTAGVHGGNRLGGNSLAEIVVFGKIAGAHIARTITKTPRLPLDTTQIESEMSHMESLLVSTRGEDPIAAKRTLQDIMWKNVGVVRTGKEMKRARAALRTCARKKLRTGNKTAQNWKLIAALNYRNMLLVCDMIIQSAQYRTESRAAHFRSDYPKTYSRWQRNIVCTPKSHGFSLATRRVKRPPATVQRLIDHPPVKKGTEHLE